MNSMIRRGAFTPIVLAVLATLCAAVPSSVRGEGSMNRFYCRVESSARDAGGNLLSVVVAIDPEDARAPLWTEWVEGHLGAPAILSGSLGMYHERDAGRIGAAPTTATAVFELDVPGQLTFVPEDGMSVSLWYRE